MNSNEVFFCLFVFFNFNVFCFFFWGGGGGGGVVHT